MVAERPALAGCGVSIGGTNCKKWANKLIMIDLPEPFGVESGMAAAAKKTGCALSFTVLIGVLAVLAPTTAHSQSQTPLWPLPSRTDLSSGYGDFRPGRFHYGIDLRTGDKNLAVVAPVSGSIAQVWVSYFGYGKSLYLAGDDGRTYVFAHLDGYAPFLEEVVRDKQRELERYFIREWFTPERFPVAQGDTIAFTGKTGIGAPHLHFETRDSENIPRSPLTQGFELKDSRGPVFESLTLESLAYGEAFSNGLRRLEIDASFAGRDGGADHYTLERLPYLSSDVGLIVRARDYPTNKQFSASPHTLRLVISDPLSFDTAQSGAERESQVYYEVTLDSLSYSEGELALCIYEQGMALNGAKDAYLLFDRLAGQGCFSGRGMDFLGRVPPRDSAGVSPWRYGVYPARIEARDASGNLSTLDFNFCWGPPGDLYRLTDISANTALVTPLDPKELSGPLLFDRLEVVELQPNGQWKIDKKIKVEELLNGAYRIKIDDLRARRQRSVYRLRLYGIDGWVKDDLIFSAIPLTDRNKLSLSYVTADAGVYLTVQTSAPTTEEPLARAQRADGATIDLRLRQVGARTFVGRLAPENAGQPVTGFAAYHSDLSPHPAAQVEGLYLMAPQDSATDLLRLPLKNGTLYAPTGGLRAPRILEIGDFTDRTPLSERVVAGPFSLGPGDFRFDESVWLGIAAAVDPAPNVAIAKLNSRGDKWDWFDTEFETRSGEGVFRAEINAPGVYALMRDISAPEISPSRPGNGGTLTRRDSSIRLKVADDLAGIWSDTLFDVRLDGEWVIPEYDAEDFALETRPNAPLAPGEHTLIVRATDNAGNVAQRTVKFFVKEK